VWLLYHTVIKFNALDIPGTVIPMCVGESAELDLIAPRRQVLKGLVSFFFGALCAFARVSSSSHFLSE
jgi:hypothetical protein